MGTSRRNLPMKRWAWAITAGCGWPCPGSATARVGFGPASRPPAPLHERELQPRRRLQPRHQPVVEQQEREQRHQVDHRVVEYAHGEELRSEEHTSELQSLMRISYAVF